MAMKRTLQELDRVAQASGYASYRDMIYDLYVVQDKSLIATAAVFHIHYARLKRHLTRFGIPIQGKGGPNNQIVHLTKALLEEIDRDGINAVSERIGVDYVTLRQALIRAAKRHQP